MMRLFLVLSLICSALTFTEAHVVLETRLTNASFEPGQTIGITWFILVDHDQIDWNLYFSQDGGDSWEPIEEGLPIEQLSYDWIAPHLESDKMLVQIVQHNNVTENYFDISDTFKIHSVESTPVFNFDREPLLADISPNPVSDEALLTVHTPLHHIAVNIYNTQGQLVERLRELGPAEEEHRFYWKTENVLSGIYYLEITADLKKRFLPVVVSHN